MTLKISVPTCDPRGAFYLTTLQAKLRVTSLCIERGVVCGKPDCEELVVPPEEASRQK